MQEPDAPIFCCPEGTSWANEQRQRDDFFYPALKACGIRKRVAYNTRHTFATINLMAGINPVYIASQLGHTTTAMLFQKYAKWISRADDGRQAAQMNAAFGAHIAASGPANWSTVGPERIKTLLFQQGNGRNGGI